MNSESSPPAPGLIEIKLDDVRQLFHSLDPTPFPGRDLDRDAEAFIVGWAREHGRRGAFTIRVYLKDPRPEDSGLIAAALDNHFTSAAEATGGRLRQLIAFGWRSLLIGLTFLAACLWIANWLDERPHLPSIVAVLREGLVIGGWVALWRPLEIFLYDWWPLQAERRMQRRLAAARVEVRPLGARY
jgi:hypothetical protein